MDISDLNKIDITIKKETHNIEYVVIIPVALVVLITFKVLNLQFPPEYNMALLGVSFYTPLTWTIIDIYSLFKTGGRYVYKIELESYNILFEILLGLIAYFITQITFFIIGYETVLFSWQSGYYFLIAYVGVTIARLIDRKLIQIGGWDNIVFAYLFTVVYLFLYSILFLAIAI